MDLSDYFKNISSDLEALSSDIPRLINSINKKEETQVDLIKKDTLGIGESRKFKDTSPRSLEPITKLRKSKEEVIEASQNKEVFFIKDKINEIFGE